MKHTSDNNSIQIWIKKACGSKASIREYLSKARIFFQNVGREPDELIREWKQVKYDLRLREQFLDEWTEQIENYVYSGECESYAPLTKRNTVAIIASFFKHNKIPVSPEYKKHAFVKYHNRDITREEVKRILEHAKLRDRTFFLMMLESGLRPDTIVQLRYMHIKKDFEANKMPIRIELPSELLKDRVEARWTFIGEDGLKILKEYLKTRLPLKSEDLIFTPERRDIKHEFLSPSSFTNIFRRITMKLGINETTERGKPKKLRLYCLRKYFMNNARYEGFDHTFKEFWMGHTNTQTHYISRDIERHREEYAKAYENLRIYKDRTEQEINGLRKELQNRDTRLVELERKVEELTGALNKESIFDNMALNLDPNVTEKAFGEAVRRATREWYDSLSDPKQAVQAIFGYLEAKQKERKKKEKT